MTRSLSARRTAATTSCLTNDAVVRAFPRLFYFPAFFLLLLRRRRRRKCGKGRWAPTGDECRERPIARSPPGVASDSSSPLAATQSIISSCSPAIYAVVAARQALNNSIRPIALGQSSVPPRIFMQSSLISLLQCDLSSLEHIVLNRYTLYTDGGAFSNVAVSSMHRIFSNCFTCATRARDATDRCRTFLGNLAKLAYILYI